MKTKTTTAIAMAILLGAGSALAAVSPDVKCRSAKGKFTGQYYACRQKALATAAVKGGMPDYTKCVSKFTEKWIAAESAAGSMCPDNFPVPTDVEGLVSSQASVTAGIVDGTGVMPVCGDGAINVAGEHCDGAALDGQTCASFGLYGSLSCTPECTVDLSACTTCPGGSMPYAGSCWVLGALGADCNAACASVGLAYDDATATVAGSSGTDAHCLALLYAIGAPGGDLENAGGDCVDGGYGCGVITEFGFRGRCGTPVTDAASSWAPLQRMCACGEP